MNINLTNLTNEIVSRYAYVIIQACLICKHVKELLRYWQGHRVSNSAIESWLYYYHTVHVVLF